MSITLIKESKHKARKDYHCDSCEFIREDIHYNGGNTGYTADEWTAVKAAEANNWRIKKGDTYLYQFLSDGGDSWSFKSIPAIHDICIRLKLYPND